MMRRLLFMTASALALSGASAGDYDGRWVYTPETHVTVVPKTAEGQMSGLDARARGFCDAPSATVDTWFWTLDCATGTVNFGPCGFLLYLR